LKGKGGVAKGLKNPKRFQGRGESGKVGTGSDEAQKRRNFNKKGGASQENSQEIEEGLAVLAARVKWR